MPDSRRKPPVRRFSTEQGEYLVQDEVFLRDDGSKDKTVTTALTFRDFLSGRTVPLRLRRIPDADNRVIYMLRTHRYHSRSQGEDDILRRKSKR